MFAAARLNTLQIMGREFYNRVMAGQEPEDAQKDLEDWYIRNKVIRLSPVSQLLAVIRLPNPGTESSHAVVAKHGILPWSKAAGLS